MEIIGTIRHVDLDTKIGRIRKKGGDHITADFSRLTHADIAEAFKLGYDLLFIGEKKNSSFVVEKCIKTS